MSQALHIFRKDLWRLRWWLALWVALVAIRTALAIFGPLLAMRGFREQMTIDHLDSLTAFAVMLMFVIVIALAVQDEPLVGLDWFWTSKPYDWRFLLGAKLLFALAFFLLLPLAAHLVLMTALGAGPVDTLSAAAGYAMTGMAWVVVFFLVAALTRSIATLIFAIVGVVIGAVLLTILLDLILLWAFVAETAFKNQTAPDVRAPLADASGSIASLVALIVAVLGVLVYAYQTRRIARTVMLSIGGLAAAIAIGVFWPWPVAATWPMDFSRVPEMRSAEATIDLTAGPRIDQSSSLLDDHPAHVVGYPVRLTNLPAAFQPQATYASSRVAYADGRVLASAQYGGTAEAESASTHPLQALFPGTRMLSLPPRQSEPGRAAILTVSRANLKRYGTQQGRLTSTIYFYMLRSRVIGALPLAPGATLRGDSFRADILRVEAEPGGCDVSLRFWSASRWWSPSPEQQYAFILHNAGRHELVAGNQNGPRSVGVGVPMLGMHIDWNMQSPSGFAVTYWELAYPEKSPAQKSVPVLDASWLAGADLVIVETTAAGWLSKSATVQGFQMQPAMSVAESRP